MKRKPTTEALATRSIRTKRTPPRSRPAPAERLLGRKKRLTVLKQTSGAEVKTQTDDSSLRAAKATDMSATPTNTSGKDTLQVVRRAQAGDTKAFEQLLENARPRAISLAMRVLHDPDDAEDAVQDAFVKVWKNLWRFEERSSFFTWVHRVVVNTSLDQRRRQACRPKPLDTKSSESRPAQEEVLAPGTPEDSLGSAEAQAVVRAALERLPRVQGRTLALRELEEHSYADIAAVSACPVGTVMSRLHHARRRLAEEIQLAVGPELEALAA